MAKKSLKSRLKGLVPGRKVSYTSKTANQPKFTWAVPLKKGLQTKVNTPKYKIPKTPKNSGRGWGA